MTGAESNKMYSAILDLVEDARYFRYTDDDVIPEPNSCAACGIHNEKSGMFYTESAGVHRWIKPSSELVLKRMKARYALRK